MKPVYALFADGEAAEHAVGRLRAAGVRDAEIVVISPRPMDEYEFAALHKDTWIWPLAVVGGAIGLCAAIGLTVGIQLAWPLRTGNMPIVSWWTNLIVMFELTMFGAIVATVITLLKTGGLLRRRPALYDPAVSEGQILVGVENPVVATRPEIERALSTDRVER